MSRICLSVMPEIYRCEDKSTDMTITVLALEQMYSIYRQALVEIRRVTRRIAMFVEPFREANDFFARIHLIHTNYFRSSYQVFYKCSFIPESFSADAPEKITFRPGILICRVEEVKILKQLIWSLQGIHPL